MGRLACLLFVLSLVAYGAGCSRRSLTYIGDGGLIIDAAGGGTGGTGGGSPDMTGARCNAYDEQLCAAHKLDGCAPQYCPGCSNTQYFAKCAGPGEPPPLCELPFCPAGCREPTDCPGAESCVPPGGSPGCGVCMPGSCSVDGDCGAGDVCDFSDCACVSSQRTCIPACTATSCPDGQQCGADGHCALIPCSQAHACPTDFQCVYPPGPGTPYCQRIPCSLDSECAGGFCVDGACHRMLGYCAAPPP